MNLDALFLHATTNTPVRSRGFRHKFIIHEYERGLLYHNGRFVKQLGPGRHVRWGYNYAVARLDLRRQTFAVAGQEVLSADHVGLKVSVAVTVQIGDPVKAMHEVQDWRTHVYNAVQLTLRTLVVAQPVETLLGQRLDLGRQLLEAVRPEAEKVGITLHGAEVKDVMFPGDLKRVFAEVVKARQEGQAALERARGESAALRNLANAARLLANNPALQNLRLLQSIGTPGQTLVLGVPGGFVPLRPAGPAPLEPGTEAAGVDPQDA